MNSRRGNSGALPDVGGRGRTWGVSRAAFGPDPRADYFTSRAVSTTPFTWHSPAVTFTPVLTQF